MAEFDVLKMSIAEIILVTGLCTDANPFIPYGRDLRAAWEALKKDQSVYLNFLNLCGSDNNAVEPPFPDELYKVLASFFDPKLMPMSKIKMFIDNIEGLKYVHLKKKYQDVGELEGEFDAFIGILNTYVNQKAKARGYSPWKGSM